MSSDFLYNLLKFKLTFFSDLTNIMAIYIFQYTISLKS